MPYRLPKAFYFFYYAAGASLVPFLTLYYESLGLSGTQIGLLSGLTPLVVLFAAPLWGAAADARRRHRQALLLAVFGASLAVVFLWRGRTMPELVPAVLLYAFFLAPIIPLADNSVMTLLGERKEDYGRIRLWGAVGWGAAATLLAPLLGRAGLDWAFYGYWLFMAGTFAVVLAMPVHAGEGQPGRRAGLGRLLGNGRFLVLLLAGLVFGMSLNVALNYLFPYMATLGASRSLMALSLTVATLSELPAWFFAGSWLRRWGIDRMIALALLLMALRMIAYSVMPAAWWVLPISLLHGPTFSFLWAAGVADADATAPPGLGATAQGAFSGATLGLGAALGGFLGGVVYEQAGGAMLFRLMGLLLALTLVAFVAGRAALGRRAAVVRS